MSAPKIHIEIVDQPIESHPDLMAQRRFLDDPDTGAHVWFYGVTRRTTGDQITESLSYEAHPTMAVKELGRLAEEAVLTFGLHRLLIVHRVGEVPVGMASVVIGCSGAHRAEVFTAVPWIMDNLKRDVPIWKRETFQDGEKLWVHPKEGGA
ncbi:Molybdopterin synthase catalytic subunit [Rubripirellula obstinata]|uniref:Molybdopterin synthase catalytic subunit n=1 Tax=Rubripirellula obstinata TaxID=406547 RepID=A0A5B1CP52_9BACT|nr:molybdenum cofactor biosynthesis protein MoaE [Rubripirellula obstinata]KAA1261380.1 Molybdopterin synthase catalytic subunit [Rubripirellula obstinata]